MPQSNPRPPLVSLAMASGAALAYQLQLVRLFSIIQWHHFAYMIISLALLGYGASGTFLSLFRRPMETWLGQAYIACIAMFAILALPAFLLAQSLAFSPEELLWRPTMIWRLACIYLVLGTPFFFVACAIGLAFMGWGRQSNRIYAADLTGAAAGSVLAIGLAWTLNPVAALSGSGILGVLAAVVAALETGRGRSWMTVMAAAYLVATTVLPAPQLQPSPYKDLASTLQVAGAQTRAVRSSPYGQVTVVTNPRVPFRDAPGMGLKVTAEPPAQLALFHDGDFASTITRDSGDGADLRFLASLPSAAPYAVASPGRVLVLEAGGGLLALQAKYLGAKQVTAVERNPDVVDLVRDDFAGFSGDLYGSPPVNVVRAHPRSFLTSDRRDWDLIQLPPSGGLGGGASGLFALTEDYLRTTEAIESMLDRLAPDGILAVQAWESLPPRGSLRLAATLVNALQRRGVETPGDSIVALRSWQMAVILVRNGRFGLADLSELGEFATTWGYDLAWYQGMPREQAQGLNRTQEPWLYDAITAFIASEDNFTRGYKFDIRPTDDDQPFFNNFLRWRTLPETVRILHSGGMALLEAGYILLLATLVQAALLATILILLPLVRSRSCPPGLAGGVKRGRTAAYFGAIGFAFMLVEVAAIHRFTLFLGEPLMASAVVVSTFLVFAGAGGLAAGALAARFGARATARTGAVAVVALGLAWLLVVGSAFDAGAGLGTAARVALVVVVTSPLAFAMGQFFPTALGALSEHAPALVPWAWAVNGCASVTGAVLATVLALALGFDRCMLVALALYLVTLFSFPVVARGSGPFAPAIDDT